jgi:uncharacterized protein (UPF0261 family)
VSAIIQERPGFPRPSGRPGKTRPLLEFTMSVLLIGTLDTKATEVAFVRDLLRDAGTPVLVADAGVLGEPPFTADVSSADLFAAAGANLADLRRANDRGQAIAAAARGAEQIAIRLHAEGKLSGVLGLGGSAGTTIATAAMRAVPVGVPKLMVSTLASGDLRPYVGARDVCMMYSVVDVAGLNRISRLVLTNAAAAMAGMVTSVRREAETSASVIAATMFGVTTPCVQAARSQLESSGVEVLTFHATGTGGRTMEGLIRDGLVSGVLDITTTELADELCGGVMAAGPDRLTAAGLKGVPQVISVGALDMVNFGPPETVPERYKGRRFYQHNPTVTLMRTTPEENDILGKQLAERACAASGPTAILLPLRGVSALDAEGQAFWWPEADAALFQSIRNWVYGVELIELDLHMNDPAFARAAADTLLRLLR